MSDSSAAARPRTPVHLWIIGVLAVLWNAIGAYDYTMTQTRNETYMGTFTEEQLAYFYGFPSWVVFFWALAVWGSVLGSILLLMRHRLAVQVFLVSLVSMVITTFHNFVLADGLAVMGGAGVLVFSGIIFVISVALYLYALALFRKGVLC